MVIQIFFEPKIWNWHEWSLPVGHKIRWPEYNPPCSAVPRSARGSDGRRRRLLLEVISSSVGLGLLQSPPPRSFFHIQPATSFTPVRRVKQHSGTAVVLKLDFIIFRSTPFLDCLWSEHVMWNSENETGSPCHHRSTLHFACELGWSVHTHSCPRRETTMISKRGALRRLILDLDFPLHLLTSRAPSGQVTFSF